VTVHAGARLGPYEIVAPLGAGGMGEVYRARDTRLGREVALKVLPAEAQSDETARSRMVREARLAAKLNHPNICTIHEVGETEGQAYIAMELVEGQPLSERLAGGRVRVEEAVRLGGQMAEALAHAHEHGVVHRDFKSGNVVVTPDGRAKVLDFGLARQLVGAELDAATTVSQASLTDAGAVAGTLAYMAPEQLRGGPADARSDIWALGVVLYEMVAGGRPFGGTTGYELSSAILNEAPKALPEGVPAGLAAVIERCLAKAPAQRYQRAGEVRSALEAVASGSEVSAWPGWRSSLRANRWPVVLAAASAALVLVAGLDLGGVRSRLLGGGDGRSIRMAVLPFANLSGDPEQEYLSDGLTQEMIGQLGRLHPETLSVIARTSVMRYKDGKTPIDQIGRELKVDYVLEGSARREGTRVRVSAELIHTGKQTQLWGDVFEREMSGVLALQRDVAQKVAESLALRLLPAERERLASARPVNPEAYEAVLKGHAQLGALTRESLDAAERYFELALEKDPGSAIAHAGIADVWVCRQQMWITLPREAGPKARAAALEAMALDDSLAAVHETLAALLGWTDWDWAGAEREYRRAIEIEPNSAGARMAYSHALLILRRPDEAMRQIERAVELDPVSEMTLSFYAVVLLCTDRFDDSIAQARQALRLQPAHGVAQNALWLALHASGRYDEVITVKKDFYDDWWPEVGQALVRGYPDAGYAAAWRRAAHVQVSRHDEEPGSAFDAAECFLFAGETARALEWLEKAVVQRDPNAPYVNCLPLWSPLRSDPRFRALLGRMNLQAAAPAGTPPPAGAAP
jgi:serine/threonine-protein kinase